MIQTAKAPEKWVDRAQPLRKRKKADTQPLTNLAHFRAAVREDIDEHFMPALAQALGILPNKIISIG